MERAAPAPRQPRRALHGVLLLDKPLGWSSNDALLKVRRLFRAEKAGHTGTLDPLASGLLPVCFGAATKFSAAGLDADKAYRATLKLGLTRVGGDLEGDVVRERPLAFDRAALDAAIARLRGEIDQVPPMHSAIKHEGRALYALARQGLEVERAPRRVTIHRLEPVRWQGDELVLDIVCSKGTYVRTLAEDLGELLGCGAHLVALRRTGSGTLRVDDATTLDALLAMDEAARDALLRPVDALLQSLPIVRLPDDEAGRFLSGLRRRVTLADAGAVRVYGPQPRAFLGSAHVTAGELIADRLLSPVEVASIADDSTLSPPSRPSPVQGEGENCALSRVNA
jgi:tRNA pseudouridine55 synthase